MTKSNGQETGEIKVATALLRDVYRLAAEYGYEGLSDTQCVRDVCYVLARNASEGRSFLTERLPALGKAFDKALLGDPSLLLECGFALQDDSLIPCFMEPFFRLVLSADGTVLQASYPQAVRWIRQVCYLFYKLKLPIPADKKDRVITEFVNNETELHAVDQQLIEISNYLENAHDGRVLYPMHRVTQCARYLLSKVLAQFDVNNTFPSHGPGSVSGKELPWDKWDWKYLPLRTQNIFALDAFFFASLDHMFQTIPQLSEEEPSARVILVPKDSRGPRLISSEPKEFQYLQQGVMRALVRLVESHPITRNSVFFTDQRPNQTAAVLGSIPNGSRSCATLDLKDASDRVSLELVRLLFPPSFVEVLEACRSQRTTLPCGKVLVLRKFAPMGSALCFPIMALTIWAILAATYSVVIAQDPTGRSGRVRRFLKGVHVYGDDVIVPTTFVDTAMTVLERFGLKLNQSKCCVQGFFRESCGFDAFKGTLVTPLRISKCWSIISPQQRYCSYIAYANAFTSSGYHEVGLLLANLVRRDFPGVPTKSDVLYEDAPFLLDEYSVKRSLRYRTNRLLQIREVCVRVPKTKHIKRNKNGWIRLLRFFNAKTCLPIDVAALIELEDNESPLTTDAYTSRHDSVLTWRWCATAPKGA
jgi:hypothetical protein